MKAALRRTLAGDQMRIPAASVVVPRWSATALVLAFLAVPFLASGIFPSQDGPAHLHTAGLLAGLRDGTAATAALFLEPFDADLTNNATYWLLSRLMQVLPPARAEWAMALLLSLLLAGTVLAAPRLLGGRPSDALSGLLLCAPIMLYMGSFALVLAMAPGFLALVFAARLARTARSADAAAFVGLSLTACAMQIQVAVPIVAATFGGIVGAVLWRWLRGGGLVVPRAFLLLAAVSLPVVAAALAYGLTGPPGHAAQEPRWQPLIQAAVLALRGDVAWFSLADPIVLTLATLVLGAAALAWLLRRDDGEAAEADAARQRLWLLASSIAVAGAVMVLPRETAAVPQVPQRLAPFAHLLLFLWFVATPLPLAWHRAVVATTVLAALTLTLSRGIGHAMLERRLHAELAWAEAQIPTGGVAAFVRLPSVLDVRYPALRQGGLMLRFDPTTHLGRSLADRDVVNFSNYQLMPAWSLFRVQFRPAVHGPVKGLTEISVMIAKGDLAQGFEVLQQSLRRVTGREIETVVLWNGGLDVGTAAATSHNLAAFLADLEAGFARTSRSAPGGFAEVWRRMTPP